MNKLFSLTMLFLMGIGLNTLKAQEEKITYPIDRDTQLINYQEVVQQPGTADELYIRAIEWLNTYYKNPADVCKVRNRESGVIEIGHRLEIYNEADGARLISEIVRYNLKMEFKPGRYRYTVSDLERKQASRYPVERWLDKSDKTYSPMFEDYLRQMDSQIKELIVSLKAGMQPPVIKVEEKW
ncbi:MAG: DUF4468 domain-containing protein [Lentimicrobium sp.]|nr:DUF4468 domain-containing protein [Lentimicrobium sp.]